jgi:hypothetical protein
MYQLPKGYGSLENVKQVLEDKLPKEYHIESATAGSDNKGFFAKMQEKMTQGFGSGKTIGEIKIKKNAYVGVQISLTSSDGTKLDYISVVDYVPSALIQFTMDKVLGYVTNLIFPAIFGTSAKLVETVDSIIMENFEANQLDTSTLGALKNIGKQLGVKKSSVKEEV